MRTLHLGARAFILPVALAAAVLFSVAPSTPAAAATYRRRASRSSRSPGRSSATRGATAPRARPPSIAPGSSSTPTERRATAATIQAGSLRSRRGRSTSTSRRAARPAGRTPGSATSSSGAAARTSASTSATARPISTLRNGVRVHGVYAVTARFTAYLHTGMSTDPPADRPASGRTGPRTSPPPRRPRPSPTAGVVRYPAPSTSARQARMAAAERSMSSSVVCQPETEMRIAARPAHVVPPSQHVPSRWTASMTARVRASPA